MAYKIFYLLAFHISSTLFLIEVSKNPNGTNLCGASTKNLFDRFDVESA
jgi:hypothetical protein